MPVKTNFFFFLACRSPAAEFFFSRFRLAGQARRKWVHCDACLDPGRAPWRLSEHPTSLSWLLFSRGRVPPRCSSRDGAWKTPHIPFTQPAPLWHFCTRSAFPPGVQHHQSNCLPSLPSATMQQQRHAFAKVADGVSVCKRVRFCVCVDGVCAVIGTPNDQEERWVCILYFAKAAAQPSSRKSIQQHNSSTAAAVQRQPRSKPSPLCQ